jgi:tetratricopeptide (TPR) repeat protein
MADEQEIPQLAPDWDPGRSQLTPAEGFLLSRIDGHTPWAQLRQIGGIPPEEVDRCLERWVSEGILTVQRPQRCAARGSRASEAKAVIDLEPGIDLTAEQQRRILEFEAELDRPYHSLLGVDRDADAKAIKRAYFALSKEFHPDRHFRRKVGSFAPRLDRIFKKVVEAYELLSDPATRAEIERSMSQAPPPPPAADAADADRAVAGPPVRQISSKRAALERLRSHFKIPEKLMTERRFKAKQFFQAAMVSAKKGHWIEAGASIRLAIAFDPWNDEYKGGFSQVQAQVHQLRAAELLREADASLDAKSQQVALRLLEEALSYRPCDPEINEKAARLALELGELESAREYVETACELNPDSAALQCLLGRIMNKAGVRAKASAAWKRALEIDPDHAEAKSELERLKRNRRSNR